MSGNVEMLVRVAQALSPLKDEVVFVGGAVVDLFITDPAAPRPRFTQDVDVVVEVATYAIPPVRESEHALESRHDIDDQILEQPSAERRALPLVLAEPQRPQLLTDLSPVGRPAAGGVPFPMRCSW